VDNALGMLSSEFTNLTTQAFTRLLETARRSNQRLRLLVDDLLNAGNIRAGRFVVDPHPVELARLVDGVVESMRPSLTERHQRLDLELSPEASRVLADERYAPRVLANLVANASKYGPDGDVIEVRADALNGDVVIAVEDHGAGIAPEEQVGVFERFYRARTGDRPGFGLGLAIAKNIVEAHGGQIGLYSEVGQGTRVWFTLPKVSDAA
jgi:signal transduction histidine kinase